MIEFLKNYGQRFMTLYRRQGLRPSPWKRNAKKRNVVQEGLTNNCEKKRSEKQRRKGKILLLLAAKGPFPSFFSFGG